MSSSREGGCDAQRYPADGEGVNLRYTATRCNTLQHTATHCNTLLVVAAPTGILEAVRIKILVTLQHAATRCNMLQHAVTPGNTRQHTLGCRGAEGILNTRRVG